MSANTSYTCRPSKSSSTASKSLDETACRATRLLNLISCAAMQVDQRLHLNRAGDQRPSHFDLAPTQQDFSLKSKQIGRKMSDSISFRLLLPSFTQSAVHSSTIFPSFRNESKTSIPKRGVCLPTPSVTHLQAAAVAPNFFIPSESYR